MEYCYAKSCDPSDRRPCDMERCFLFPASGPCEHLRVEKHEESAIEMPPPCAHVADLLREF